MSLSLSSTTVRSVAVGQSAQVTMPGSTEPVTATVSWVSPVASSGSNSRFPTSSTYAVDVTVAPETLADRLLPQGARADVAITVGQQDAAVTVPTSAVVKQTNDTVVRVLTDQGVTTKQVTVGLIGAARTEITAGLGAGDVVVLADLDATVDAAGEVQTTTSFPGGGSFPRGGSGGSFPRGGSGGNFPGGAPPAGLPRN